MDSGYFRWLRIAPLRLCVKFLASSPLVGQIVDATNGATRMTTTKSFNDLNRLTGISSAPEAQSPKPTTDAYPCVAQGPEHFQDDADGNLTNDGRWAYFLTTIDLGGIPADYNVILNFTNYSSAYQPMAGLVWSGDTLYDTTSQGGAVFKVNSDGSDFNILSNGSYPSSAGLLLNGNILYGNGNSEIFMTDTDFTFFMFAGGSFGKSGDLVLSDNALYLTTYSGGASNQGAICRSCTDHIDILLNTVLHSFTNTPDGAAPLAGLVLGGSTLYGTTAKGGVSGNGTVFKINTEGTGYAILCSFSNSPDGAYPKGDLVLNGPMLYGTTQSGGRWGGGTVFALSTNGAGYTVLHHFTNAPDGAGPQAGLLLLGGTLYGTTYSGGSAGDGTVFAISTNGTGYAVLHNFLGLSNGDGRNPAGKLVAGGDELFGTTQYGGSSTNNYEIAGTIFKLTPPPPLQVAAGGAAPVVFWPVDGFTYTLQTTTNLSSGPWTTVSNGLPLIGLQVTNGVNQPAAFFRLQ
jgi:uncharacterized repeat protein (TIGR03803 family)